MNFSKLNFFPENFKIELEPIWKRQNDQFNQAFPILFTFGLIKSIYFNFAVVYPFWVFKLQKLTKLRKFFVEPEIWTSNLLTLRLMTSSLGQMRF